MAMPSDRLPTTNKRICNTSQMDDIKSFRQWNSQTPGHPENFITKGVEVTTGELSLRNTFATH